MGDILHKKIWLMLQPMILIDTTNQSILAS